MGRLAAARIPLPVTTHLDSIVVQLGLWHCCASDGASWSPLKATYVSQEKYDHEEVDLWSTGNRPRRSGDRRMQPRRAFCAEWDQPRKLEPRCRDSARDPWRCPGVHGCR